MAISKYAFSSFALDVWLVPVSLKSWLSDALLLSLFRSCLFMYLPLLKLQNVIHRRCSWSPVLYISCSAVDSRYISCWWIWVSYVLPWCWDVLLDTWMQFHLCGAGIKMPQICIVSVLSDSGLHVPLHFPADEDTYD